MPEAMSSWGVGLREKEEEVNFLSAYCILGKAVIGLLLMLSHLSLTEVLPDRCYHFPFTDDKTDVANVVFNRRSHRQNQNSNLTLFDTQAQSIHLLHGVVLGPF